MRDNTRVWAGIKVVGDGDSEPEVFEGPIGDCLMRLLVFVQGYSIGKGFVFTVARVESEVRSRLSKHGHRGIKGESIDSLISRLAQGAPILSNEAMSQDTGSLATTTTTTTTTTTHQPDSFEDRSDDPDVQAMIRKALGQDIDSASDARKAGE